MCRPGQSLWQIKVHKVEAQRLQAGFQVQWPEGVIHVTRVLVVLRRKELSQDFFSKIFATF